ncbi:hypothetical protein [Salinibacter ruber]|uniref:Uncharacterized protein n=1 Tax=Salinibacter ruber TaxID=146919 RepID=A0AAW5P8P2_9BACT|nr:hypothetical protein [Salinibacter ruber]MCS4157785.1 hypothetical protein [Salinibacter ruber]
MRCPCCKSEGVSSFETAPKLNAVPDPFSNLFVNAPIETRFCQVCGYKWQRAEHPQTSLLVVLHDLSPGVMGQAMYGAPSCALMEKRSHGAPSYFRISRHSDAYEEIDRDQFQSALRRRQKARGGAIRN